MMLKGPTRMSASFTPGSLPRSPMSITFQVINLNFLYSWLVSYLLSTFCRGWRGRAPPAGTLWGSQWVEGEESDLWQVKGTTVYLIWDIRYGTVPAIANFLFLYYVPPLSDGGRGRAYFSMSSIKHKIILDGLKTTVLFVHLFWSYFSIFFFHIIASGSYWYFPLPPRHPMNDVDMPASQFYL